MYSYNCIRERKQLKLFDLILLLSYKYIWTEGNSSQVPTCFGDFSVLHEDDQVGLGQELGVVSAQHAGLVSQQSHDALRVQVHGHVGVHGRQGIVQQVDSLVLETHHTPLAMAPGESGTVTRTCFS